MIIGHDIAIFIDNKSGAKALLFEFPARSVAKKSFEEISKRVLFPRTEEMSEGLAWNANGGGGADIDHGRSCLFDELGKRLGEPDHLGFPLFALLITTGAEAHQRSKADRNEKDSEQSGHLRFRHFHSFTRLLKNTHLLRCPHPSSLRSLQGSAGASLLRISGALHLDIFEQPEKILLVNPYSKLLIIKYSSLQFR